MQIADEDVMVDVQAGALDRMTVLFERYQGPLYQFYRRNGHEAGVAEDLVQDVFFRVLRFRQTYKQGANFRSWLYQIARNVRVDYLRKSMRETAVEDEFGDTFTVGAKAHEQMESAENARMLKQALARLPERKRELLILSRYQGLKYKEIAEMMGCDVNTIKVRIHRSVQELRELYQGLTERRAT